MFNGNLLPKQKKIEITIAIGEIFKDLQKTNDFLVHCYVKRKQAAHMEELIASCDGENIVLQVDFSENATISLLIGIILKQLYLQHMHV